MRGWWFGAGGALLGYALLELLGRRVGSNQDERRRAIPGDELVRRPHIVTDHAVTIDAAPKAVWPWLAQMGWHLGGYYTHLRVRGSLAPRWFGWIYQSLIVPADYVMALGMLHGIAKRAAARATPQPSGRIPYRPPAAAECNEMSPDAFIASAERSRPHRTRQTLGGTT